jgi:hypothetical protein
VTEPPREDRVRGVLTSAALAVVLLASCAGAACGTTTSTKSPRRLFAPTSVWNAPVGRAAVDHSSKRRVRAFVAEVRREIHSGSGPWISDVESSTPFYVVPRSTRRVPVELDTGSWGAQLQQALARGVPIPRGAKAAAGPDEHLSVYQPSTDTLWELWKAVHEPDGWHASWGGVMEHVSSSPGYFTQSSYPGLKAPSGWNWGATATSLPVIAGTVRIGELRAGVVPHALALSVPDACARVFTWPAQRTDGSSRARNCLPEGAHLRLDPKLDLSKLDLPPVTRVLAEAAQRYGIIVRDVSHHSVGFYAEDPLPTGANPYAGPDGLYDGLRPWSFLPQFPWADLQLVRMHTCASAPCLPPRGPHAL